MSTFLESLDADLRDAILQIGKKVTFNVGEAVFIRGDPGKALFVIDSGSVRIHDGELTLNELEAGEAFGEIAGLGGLARTASVTAREDLVLLRIERDELFDVVQSRPAALRGLVQMLCERESGIANRMTSRSWRLRAAEQELEIGRRIQAGFLPDALPDIEGYDVAGYFQAARVVAGDFYDAFYIPAIDRLALVIGDVCDKGVGAALFMTLFRSLIRATAQSRTFVAWATDHDPGRTAPLDDTEQSVLAVETLTNTAALTNNYIATTHGKTSMFASAFIGLVEPASGELTYINAGHEEAFIIGDDGIRMSLPTTGPVLGLFPGVQQQPASARLEPGETLLLYTDGVPEATSESGDHYAEDRLREVVTQWRGNAAELLDAIRSDIEKFTGNAQQHDDITMLASHRKTA